MSTGVIALPLSGLIIAACAIGWLFSNSAFRLAHREYGLHVQEVIGLLFQLVILALLVSTVLDDGGVSGTEMKNLVAGLAGLVGLAVLSRNVPNWGPAE